MTIVTHRYAIAAQEDRCAPRTRLTLPARLRMAGGRRFDTVVRDLSLSGFSAAAINRQHPGTVCWLNLPGMASLLAEVVWWDNSVAGCALADLLSPIVHDNLVALYQRGGIYRPV